MPRKALSLILFGLSTLGLTAQSTTLYWVGGNGNWNEPANWSASASGAGSTSLVPTAETQVVLQSTRARSVEVFITGAAVCHSLSIADQAVARVLPSGTLSLTALDDPSRVINAGAVVVQSPPAPGMRSAMTDGPGLWYAPDALAGDGFTPLSLMDTDCGTGGADPYNIDIQIQSDYNGQAISCNTASDGALTVNVTGGIGPFSFQWVGGSLPPTFTESINGLAAGTYTVLVTDLGQGTICSETVVLSTPPAITLLDFTPSPPSCTSLCDGSATVLAIGGTGALDYNWSNGETGQVASLLCNGNNTLTVTDANDCVYTTDITLALDTLYANININNILCGGEPDGSAEANPVGGDGGPYTINWSNGDSGPIMSDEFAGIYSATILDGNGCQVDTTFEILEEPPLVLTLDNTTEPSCSGSTDGAIFVSVTGGLPPYETDWTGPDGFTSTSEDVIAIGAGAYTLTVIDANGCEQVLGVVLDEPDVIDATAVVTPLSCAGAADGAIDLTPSGGASPYDFVWTALPFFTAFTEDISGLEDGTYNVLITDQTGCFTLLSFDLTEPDPLQLDLALTPITCPGTDDGEIDLTIAGGTPEYTISWDLDGSGTAASEDLTGLAPGTYTVTVTDANDCVETASVTLDDALAIDLSAVATPVSCFGDTDGAIDLTVSSGAPPIDLEWTGPSGFTSTSEDLVGLEPGAYAVTATDAGGCVETLDVSIDEPLEITIDATATPLACADDTNGTIDVDISGGTAPYDTDWTGPGGFTSAEEDLSGLEAGTYTLTVTDANDCQLTVDVEITAPDPIDVAADITDILCSGDDTGAIDLTITGGTPGYDASWVLQSGGSSTAEDLTDLAAGDYEVTVTDGAGCQVVINYTVAENPPFDLTETITPLSCAGAADGTIALTLMGGSLPFDFNWGGPGGFTAATQDIFGLEAGPYDVDITDALGCTESYSFMVTEPDAIVLSADITDTSCGNTNDGEIDMTITAGVSPLDIDWTGLGGFTSSSEDLTGLEAGTYDVTVTDADGCQQTSSFDVLPGAVLDITIATADVSCFGAMDGFLDLSISGGTPPIDVVWTLPSGGTVNSEDLNGLGPGTYEALIEDASGCTVTIEATVNETPAFDVTANVTDATCAGLDDGAIELIITGGVGPYDVDWGFTTGPTITGLAAGPYNATITDALGCPHDLNGIMVDEAAPIVVDVTHINETCPGAADGTIDILSITGGTDPITLSWTGPGGFTSADNTLSGLEAGTYDLLMEDANGCQYTESIEVVAANPLVLTSAVTDPPCGGISEISLDLDGGNGWPTDAGGTPITDWLVEWTADNGFALTENVANNSTITDLEAGTYTVTVTDFNGCSQTLNFDIQNAQALDVQSVVIQPSCGDADNGSIELAISGGTAPMDVLWTADNGFSATSADVTDLEAGTYVVEVTDALGCFYSEAFEVAQPEQLLVELTAGDVLCADSEDGAILTTVTGGVGPYAFTWTGPNGFTDSAQNPADLAPGCYQVTVTDANGCAAAAEVCIGAPAVLELTATLNPILCAGDSTGSIEWVPSGGVGGFMGSWTGPLSNLDNLSPLDSLIAGDYTLALLDANGCPLDTTFTITEPAPIVLTANTTSPLCVGESNGTIDATLGGGTPDYTIGWTGPDGFTADTQNIADVAAGWYTYTITDDAGCVVTDSLELAAPLPLSAKAVVDSISCFGFEDAGIDLTPTGGMAPYGFTWNGPDGFTADTEDLTDLAPGTYEVLITDLAGCTGTLTFDLLEPTELVVTLTGTSPASCPESEDGSATLQISGGTPEYNVVWSGPLGYTSLEQNPTDLAGGQYAVTVEDANGCQTALQPIDIETLGGVEADAGADLTACEETGPWTLSGTNTGGSSEGWYDADGVQINTSSTLEIQPEPGVYEFIYIANDGLCSDADTVVVEILTSPLADAGADMDVYLEEVVELGGIPAVDDDSIWDWSPGTLLQDSTVANPFTLEITGPQSYILDVVAANGCVASDTITIGITPLLEIPTGFSPNEDGMNDAWTLGFLSFYPNVVVQIYNRWGDLLVESAPGYPEPWDGTYQGDPLPIGTYYYVIRVNEPEFPDPLTGPVTILR